LESKQGLKLKGIPYLLLAGFPRRGAYARAREVGNNHMLQGPILPDLVRVQAPAVGHCSRRLGHEGRRVCHRLLLGSLSRGALSHQGEKKRVDQIGSPYIQFQNRKAIGQLWCFLLQTEMGKWKEKKKEQ
jgi:hypothetical protein